VNISVVFSTISTGGFSPVNDMTVLGGFPDNFILALLMILGATSFPIHYRIFSGKFRKAFNAEFVVFILIILSGTALFALFAGTDVFKSFFYVSSASSTAGFSLTNLGGLAVNAKMLLFILMFIGGPASSTAGGIKIMRLIIFVKSIPWAFKGLLKGELDKLTFRGKEVSYLDVSVTLVLILVAIVIVIGFALIFTCFGFTFVDSVFELTAALSNAGLSVGVASISLPVVLKLLLMLVMIVGRVGIIAFFVALIRGSTLRNHSQEIAKTSQNQLIFRR
jgi:trk system potassium uptake protein TrkH